MDKQKKRLYPSIALLTAFALWTAAVCLADVQAIGPLGSPVGLASLNRYVHQLTGVRWNLYSLTDWLGLIPLGTCAGFGLLGLKQWMQRKSLLKVDRDLLVLGGFDAAVLALYIFFEVCRVNCRPVLINGFLETSYPSSTTMLVLCIMPTALMQLNARLQNNMLKKCLSWLIGIFTAFMVAARLISGVHWFSDIVGGILISSALVMAYRFLVDFK